MPAAGEAVAPAVRAAREAAEAAASGGGQLGGGGGGGGGGGDELEIPRQRKELELDRAKRQARDAWVEHVIAQKDKFNALVSDLQHQVQVDRPTYPALPTL